jgi:DNA-binding response OmpR family regulator
MDRRNGKPTLLLVDDEVLILELLEVYLSELGFNVLTAGNGKEALERISTEHADLIILDLNMPVMSGERFIQELRRRGLETPILVVSGHCLMDKSLEHEVAQLIKKPFSYSVLVSSILEILS